MSLSPLTKIPKCNSLASVSTMKPACLSSSSSKTVSETQSLENISSSFYAMPLSSISSKDFYEDIKKVIDIYIENHTESRKLGHTQDKSYEIAIKKAVKTLEQASSAAEFKGTDNLFGASSSHPDQARFHPLYLELVDAAVHCLVLQCRLHCIDHTRQAEKVAAYLGGSGDMAAVSIANMMHPSWHTVVSCGCCLCCLARG